MSGMIDETARRIAIMVTRLRPYDVAQVAPAAALLGPGSFLRIVSRRYSRPLPFTGSSRAKEIGSP
jgi:hypothetical protein